MVIISIADSPISEYYLYERINMSGDRLCAVYKKDWYVRHTSAYQIKVASHNQKRTLISIFIYQIIYIWKYAFHQQTVTTISQTVTIISQTVTTISQTVTTISQTVTTISQTVTTISQTVTTISQTIQI